MRVLIIGQGGREHALAQKISESKQLQKLWVAPGNPGMSKVGIDCVPIEISEKNIPDVVKFCQAHHVDLVVLGPEAAILSDLKEKLEVAEIPCLAPSRAAAQLEASKIFCKQVLNNAGLKTASFQAVSDLSDAMKLISLHSFSRPLVIKVDGLAQGKGVHVCSSRHQAEKAVQELSAQFSFPFLFEECLDGQELSAFALCDGEDFIFLGTACDYKRINQDMFSANTGGMGAFSPCDFLTPDDEAEINEIFQRSMRALKKQGTPFVGFLFAGLMKTHNGIYVLEFNVRLGDPETQALLPRLKSDFLELIVRTLQGRLKGAKAEVSNHSSVHVVAVSAGYPGRNLDLGHVIEVPISSVDKAQIYYSGVGLDNGHLVNSGGRVLGVTAIAESRSEARELAYREIKRVHFKGLYLREDIAL